MHESVSVAPVGKPFWYTATFPDVDAGEVDELPTAITIGAKGFVWTTLSWDDGSIDDLNLRIWDEGRGGESFSTARLPVVAMDDNLPLSLGVRYPFRPHSVIRMECENDGASANGVLQVILGGYEPTARDLARMLTEYDGS